MGLILCSIGLSECPDEIIMKRSVFIDKAKRYYKKCIIHQDRLVGTILIGDKSEFLEFRELIANKTELKRKAPSIIAQRQARPNLFWVSWFAAAIMLVPIISAKK
jgi:NAD(P)H-nitrite reductase large subunit